MATLKSIDLSLALPGIDQSQRWFDGRSSFRLSREAIDPRQFGVEMVDYATAKAFVCRHHYSGTFSPSIASFGLFRKDSASSARLAGVATFAPASNINSVARWTGLEFAAGAELARFVLLDEVAGNGESWFLTRALEGFKRYRPGARVVLSYSDPVPRTRLDGSVVFPGHYGCIYASVNALYLGRASAKTQYLAPDGRVLANRILSKLRNGEIGRAYAERSLADISGLPRLGDETAAAYVERALGVMRAQHHPGNHLYLFPLAADRREKRLILGLPRVRAHSLGVAAYPKQADRLAA